jgi:hypothetical protein
MNQTMTNINELKPIAESLNDASNDINNIINDLNARLEKLNLGITVDGPIISEGDWETYFRDEHRQEVRFRYRSVDSLGYAKVGDKWQLCVFTCNEEQDVNESGRWEKDPQGNDVTEYIDVETIPLSQAPRSTRVKALTKMEQLLTTMKNVATEQIKAINAAREMAKKEVL